MNLYKNSLGRLTAILSVLLFISAFSMINTDEEEKLAESNAAMIADWQWAKGYTLSYIESMPESGLDTRPVDSVRSFSEQMLHITSANVGIIAQATGVPPTIENIRELEKSKDYGNKKALSEIVAKGYDYVIAAIEATPGEKMNEKIKLFGQYEMTIGDAFQKTFIHQNHHRGQCAVYIRMAGGVPAQMKLF